MNYISVDFPGHLWLCIDNHYELQDLVIKLENWANNIYYGMAYGADTFVVTIELLSTATGIKVYPPVGALITDLIPNEAEFRNALLSALEIYVGELPPR